MINNMKHFLLNNADGGVQVMQIVPQDGGVYSTPEVEMAKWSQEKRSAVKSWREIKTENLPVDRTFRNAWRDAEPSIDIDMPRARNIQRDRLRELRAPKLAALDIEMTRAFNDNAKQTTIEARRQLLRDVTKNPSIEAATTPAELKASDQLLNV